MRWLLVETTYGSPNFPPLQGAAEPKRWHPLFLWSGNRLVQPFPLTPHQFARRKLTSERRPLRRGKAARPMTRLKETLNPLPLCYVHFTPMSLQPPSIGAPSFHT